MHWKRIKVGVPATDAGELLKLKNNFLEGCLAFAYLFFASFVIKMVYNYPVYLDKDDDDGLLFWAIGFSCSMFVPLHIDLSR